MSQTTANLNAEFEPTRRVTQEFPAVDWGEITNILEELPPGMPILAPEEQGNFSKYHHKPSRVYSKGAAWQHCADALEKHDAELCKAYREEIDTLLVFAGLFSAVVTAFSVESYEWLQDDPSDVVIGLLSEIARSISQNGTGSVVAPTSPSTIPNSVSIRINAYWFLSLSLSLAAALVAILGKQWVREFERHAAMSPRESVGVRQMKFEGLQYWMVGDIISVLPLLLQLSLAVFALGIIELLWRLHTGVAIMVCVPVSTALLFYLSTTLLPVLQLHRLERDLPAFRNITIVQCSYKSPQAWLAMRAYRLIPQAWLRLRLFTLNYLCPSFDGLETPLRAPQDALNSWSDWDYILNSAANYGWSSHGPASHFRGLAWLRRHMDQSNAKEWIWHCLWDEAVEKGTEPVSLKLQAGLCYVLDSATGSSGDQKYTQRSPSSLALLYLHHTNMPSEFITEVLIQNLSLMDVPSAKESLGQLQGADDPNVAISLARAVSSYSRRHIRDDLGKFLLTAWQKLVLCTDLSIRWRLMVCVAAIFSSWLRVQQTPSVDALRTTRWLLLSMVKALQDEQSNFVQHPEGLRDVPYIEKIAALTKSCAEIHGIPIAWPPDPAFRRRFIELGLLGIHTKPIVLELLRISIFGINRRAGTPQPGLDTVTSSAGASQPSRFRASNSPPVRAVLTVANANAEPSRRPGAGNPDDARCARTRLTLSAIASSSTAPDGPGAARPPPPPQLDHSPLNAGTRMLQVGGLQDHLPNATQSGISTAETWQLQPPADLLTGTSASRNKRTQRGTLPRLAEGTTPSSVRTLQPNAAVRPRSPADDGVDGAQKLPRMERDVGAVPGSSAIFPAITIGPWDTLFGKPLHEVGNIVLEAIKALPDAMGLTLPFAVTVGERNSTYATAVFTKEADREAVLKSWRNRPRNRFIAQVSPAMVREPPQEAHLKEGQPPSFGRL